MKKHKKTKPIIKENFLEKIYELIWGKKKESTTDMSPSPPDHIEGEKKDFTTGIGIVQPEEKRPWWGGGYTVQKPSKKENLSNTPSSIFDSKPEKKNNSIFNKEEPKYNIPPPIYRLPPQRPDIKSRHDGPRMRGVLPPLPSPDYEKPSDEKEEKQIPKEFFFKPRRQYREI